jgi:hypothetical protein
MKIVRFLGSRNRAAYALAAVSLGAVALAALGSFVPDEALGALRSLNPGETPFLQLLLLGWIGVALGRLTIRANPTPPSAAVKRRAGTQLARRRRSTGSCAISQRCCRPI